MQSTWTTFSAVLIRSAFVFPFAHSNIAADFLYTFNTRFGLLALAALFTAPNTAVPTMDPRRVAVVAVHSAYPVSHQDFPVPGGIAGVVL